MKGQDLDEKLMQKMLSFQHDPLGFVQFSFPWGEPGSPLEKFQGPQLWQAESLNTMAWDAFKRPGATGKARQATGSGKGIGKSAEVSWIILWLLATFPETRGVVTAGTEPQLRTKTWPELAKWYNLFIAKHWFRMIGTSIYSVDPTTEKLWRMDAIPWNENNPEAFAGLHNIGKRIGVVFDEASQIADPIWDTTDGIFSDKDTEVLWFAFGNPTRGTGRFRAAAEEGSGWRFRAIDSRSADITDKEELARQVEEYGGEDSDLTRVNIRGLFPRMASIQFIPNELVREARKREATCQLSDPLILGVDIARFGDDMSVIAARKGRDARTIPWKYMAGFDTVAVAQAIAEYYRIYKPDAINVDGGNSGGGVIDLLRSWNIPVTEVSFGGKPDRWQLDKDATKYANKRAEMWGLMRAALPTLAIPDDQVFEDQAVCVQYGYKGEMEILLEPKKIMKARGDPSPDRPDALALTYAYPVQPKVNAGGVHATHRPENQAVVDYDPFEYA